MGVCVCVCVCVIVIIYLIRHMSRSVESYEFKKDNMYYSEIIVYDIQSDVTLSCQSIKDNDNFKQIKVFVEKKLLDPGSYIDLYLVT